ncbi:cytochrome P450 [Nocardia vinacea]|uniref:cytochrome P450 n=1 Tax=Nocardia vinacea TaxID=96468 RepID=UPI0002EF66E5
MTTHTHHPPESRSSVGGSPGFGAGPRIVMYTPEFAADPHRAYGQMRKKFGSLVPVDLAPGVPATLVIGYYTAIRILTDPDHFPADPRTWERNIPAECPVLAMMKRRENALRTDGQEHKRYRESTSAAINDVDLLGMHAVIEQIAIPLINTFCADGHADVLQCYVFPLVFTAVNTMLGVDADIGARVAAAMDAMFDAGAEVGAGDRMLHEALRLHTERKREEPGDDITTRLMRHPSGLTDEEVIQQLVTHYAIGVEPLVHLIGNALRLMLTDDRFAAGMHSGSLSTRDALDEVLFTDPPLANYCISYPRQPVLLNGVWLPAHQPVVISMAACNSDPTVNAVDGVERDGNRSHLAFSAGPHMCPAQDAAYLIAQDAIDQLLDALPEIELAGPAAELGWRTGPFHRALTALPVVFPKSDPFPEFPPP